MPSQTTNIVSPLLSVELWTAAIVEYQQTWQAREQSIFHGMQEKRPEAFAQALGYYRVARTVSSDPAIRNRLRALVNRVRLRGQGRRALANFATHVERIAVDIGEHQTHGRPISAVSKLLFQLHPDDGFIFDRNAFLTVIKLFNVGQRGDTLENFRLFTKAYLEGFIEIRQKIRGLLTQQKSTMQAARLIDKVLWLQSDEDCKNKIKRLLKRSDQQQRLLASEIVESVNRLR